MLYSTYLYSISGIECRMEECSILRFSSRIIISYDIISDVKIYLIKQRKIK